MFPLFVVTILSGTGVVLGDPGLESAASGSFGFGAAGGYSYGSHGNSYGDYGNSYGSRYLYNPGYHFNDGYRGYSNVYIPGRQNPFISYVRKSVSPSPQTVQLPSNQRFASEINSDHSYFMPETRASNIKSIPCYNVPYFESVETYKFYSPSRTYMNNQKEAKLNLDSIDTNDKNVNGSLESTTPAKEPVLKLTYLGYVPQSSFRSASESGSADDSRQKIPFYLLDYKDESSASPRSGSASPTVYSTPIRLVPTSAGYPTGNNGFTGQTSSSSAGVHAIPTRGLPSHIPARARAVVSPYQSPSISRSASTDDQPGYHIIDVDPVSSEPMLGAPQPTFPWIQTLTGLMGGPISELSRGPAASSQPQSKVPSIDVDPVSRQSLLGAPRPTFPWLQTPTETIGGQISKESDPTSRGLTTSTQPGVGYELQLQNGQVIPVQNYNAVGQQGYNNGYGLTSFGTPAFEDSLVRHLIAV